MTRVEIIGGGLAGCEAALTLARFGIPCRIWEMRPQVSTAAHKTPFLAELICSNSLGSKEPGRASNLLKQELTLLGSNLLRVAKDYAVPAGGALAVDRAGFAIAVSELVESNGLIEVCREEIKSIPEDGIVIVAAGPLVSEKLTKSIKLYLQNDTLYFYDAIAPIIADEGIDKNIVFASGRRNQSPDYLNCPLNEQEYNALQQALVNAELIPLRELDEGIYYEACLPVEEIARRSPQALRFGPLRAVGLKDPRTDSYPYAVVQLRREDTSGSSWSLVGFQSRMLRSDQELVFRQIPGLKDAFFLRYGSAHRNTFIDGTKNLNCTGQLINNPRAFFAGQLAGVEGYLESVASGLFAGWNAARMVNDKNPSVPSNECITGAILRRVSGEGLVGDHPTPVGAEYGLLAELEVKTKDRQVRRNLIDERALSSLSDWIKSNLPS